MNRFPRRPLKTTPDIDNDRIIVEAAIEGQTPDRTEMSLYDGPTLVACESALGAQPVELSMPADAKLWTPDTPALYDMEVKIYRNGEVVDRVRSYAAYRKYSGSPRRRRTRRSSTTCKRPRISGSTWCASTSRSSPPAGMRTATG